MALSTDITLAKGLKPVFPAKCLVCHKKPDSTLRMTQNTKNSGIGFFLPILTLSGRSQLDLPVCRSCKARFRFQRWGRDVVWLTLILMLIWWLMPLFKEWPGLTQKLAVGGLVLLALAPFSVLEVFWPRCFDMTVRGDTIEYEFASEEYATEFLKLNSVAPLDHVYASD